MSEFPPYPAPPPVPVFRQDEFTREPSSWTRPMQAAAGAYFIVSGVLSVALTLLLHDAVKAQIQKSLEGSGQAVTAEQLQAAFMLGLVFASVFALLYVVLGALTLVLRRTWLFWVDLVLLGLSGIVGTLSGLVSVAGIGANGVPLSQSYSSLVLSLIALGIFIWMLIGVIQRGPWAQQKVPVAL